MKDSLKYIQEHKDDLFIFDAADRMIKDGFDDDTVLLNVIIYLRNLVKTKEEMLKIVKEAS